MGAGLLPARQARSRERPGAAHRIGQPAEQGPHLLSHRADRTRPAVDDAAADHVRQAALHVQPVRGNQRALVGAGAGHAGRALHLQRPHRSAGRPARRHERGKRPEGHRRRRLEIHHAAADTIVSAGDRHRRNRRAQPRPAHRRLRRAGAHRSGGLRNGRHRKNGQRRRIPVRAIPLGALRHDRAAAVLPHRRHGKSAPDLRHADHDRRRPQPGRPDRARDVAFVVRQPGDQRVVEALLAQRRLHHLCDTRVVEKLYGTEVADINLQVEQEEAMASLTEIPPAKQALITRDPDTDPHTYTDGELVYPKGAWFLRTLEQRAGRDVFDPFLRGWFDQHAFQSATTDDFLAYLHKNLLAAHPEVMSEAEINEWVYGPGIPLSAKHVVSPRLAAVDVQRAAWLKGETATKDLDTKNWIALEWIHFLDDIDGKATAAQLKELDQAFALGKSGNDEIAFRFFLSSVKAGYDVREPLNAFLMSVGRQKFVVPLYTALLNNPNEKTWAQALYAKARPHYHPETQASVDKQFAKK